MTIADPYIIRRCRGRPRLNKPDKFAGMMRMTERLKAYLVSEKGANETLAECCLRLLTKRGTTIGRIFDDIAGIAPFLPPQSYESLGR